MNRKPVLRELTPERTKRARELRRNSSVAETIAWDVPRMRQLGFDFRRQQIIGPYTLDFYCHEARIAIEFDGERHDGESDALRDQ